MLFILPKKLFSVAKHKYLIAHSLLFTTVFSQPVKSICHAFRPLNHFSPERCVRQYTKYRIFNIKNFFVIFLIKIMMVNCFGLSFVLFYLKLSAGHGFKTKNIYNGELSFCKISNRTIMHYVLCIMHYTFCTRR